MRAPDSQQIHAQQAGLHQTRPHQSIDRQATPAIGQGAGVPRGKADTHRSRSAAWTARTNRNTGRAFRGAVRYSRFVRLMKLLLPVVAFAIAAALAVFSVMHRSDDGWTITFTEIPSLDDDRLTLHPTFSGSSTDGRRYRIEAESAEVASVNARDVKLHSLIAEMSLPDHSSFKLSAPQGLLDLENEKITLSGEVSFESDSGYSLSTQEVLIDVDAQEVFGRHAVRGEGPAGTVRADSFVVKNEDQTVRFEGNVVMTIDPGVLTGARSPVLRSFTGNEGTAP